MKNEILKRTKVICTLGPAVDDDNILAELINNGMDVARLNFSHGSHEEQLVRADRVKKIRTELNRPVALLLDTKGPEIRTGKFLKTPVELVAGNTFTLTNQEILGDSTICSISYNNLYQDVQIGDKILIDDGLVELAVTKIEQENIICTILNGGYISNNKGINVPNVSIKLPALTDKDISDIIFAAAHDFDFIAASFVRKKEDVEEIRQILQANNGADLNIIAKIENQEGIDNIDQIIAVSDGIMVARGDLGVEIPTEQVPIVQKEIIAKCRLSGKPVIIATQMLDSMMRNPRPTRAEASDVANAIYDGTGAIMLSGETAAGKYPVESLKTMVKIAQATEGSINYNTRFRKMELPEATVTNAISHATVTTAQDLNAKAIITVTTSGHTARMIARFLPCCPIIASTRHPKAQRQLMLSWGVQPYLRDEDINNDNIFSVGANTAKDAGMVETGDLVVVTAGLPIGISGTTNLLKVHIVE